MLESPPGRRPVDLAIGKLSQSMHHEALLLQACSEMLLLIDAQSLQIVAASPSVPALLGYVPDALQGMAIGDIECALSDLFFWDELKASLSPLEAQGSFRRADGSMFDILKVAKPVDADGKLFVLRATPIATLQRSGPAVTDAGLHLAATLEATEDSLLLTDTDGTILNMNRRFSELWALPPELLSERNDHGIIAHIASQLQDAPAQRAQETTLHQVVALMADPVGDTFETLQLKDGRVIECFSHPARNADRTIGRVFCYRDVTERTQYEKSLKQARDKAELATTSKSQFLANMSHEIRTPMNAILGMLKLLQGADLNSRQFDYASKAEGAAQSLLGLLNDILDFSKIDAGKMTLDLQPFKPDRLLRDLSVILSANLGKKPVELLFDIDPAIAPHLVGDAMRLQQVLINLAGNAVKFTQQGEVVVQIKVLLHSGADTTLRIAVKDTGIGIAPEHQKNLFEDFAQAEASTTRRFGGTGLGLSISKRLVALMGGSLQCNSVIGQGSEFYFFLTLPVAEAPLHEPDTRLAHSYSAMQVLMVDDNPVALALLKTMGVTLGWQVDTASSGAQAVNLISARAAAEQPPYEAIFMDWEMPGMDGWQTIAFMRQTLACAKVPITVMVTAHDRHALEQRSASELACLNAYLVKPVTASMMRDVIVDARCGHSNLRTHRRASHVQPGRLLGMRLLVAEDNLINQQVAKELLSAEGALVELADNGALAVAAVAQASQSIPFDAVLMDIQMPVMDGFAATRAIRENLGLAHLPVIAMTANAMASDRDDCLAAGMNDHVGKPFDLKHLVKLLLKLTGFKATAQASAKPSAE